MTGGRRPPGPTPPSWLDTLPVITSPEALVNGAFYIAVTTVTGATSTLTNPVLEYSEGALHIVRRSTSSNSAWFYDADAEELKSNGASSSGMAEALRAFLGEEFTVGGSLQGVEVTQEAIVGKFI